MVALPAGPIAQRPWARQACRPDRGSPGELACVNGVAVTVADYERVRGDYPREATPAQVVEALVQAELLAGAAAAEGLWGPWLQPALRVALAQQWLRRSFEPAHTAEKIAPADIALAFRNPTIRVRYHRHTAYFVTDVQMLCCSGDWRQCNARKDVAECIERFAPAAARLHQLLSLDPPASGPELEARVAALREQFPDATTAVVQFYYDKSKSYDQQEGYDLMVEPFSLAVVELQPGQLSAPIRSPFGWHIARLDRLEPALRGKPEDPTVRDDIARNILPLVRQRDLQKELFARMAELGVRIHYDRLTRTP